MVTTRISAHGQVILPKEVRDRLNLEQGQELEVEVVSGTIVLRPTAPAQLGQAHDWENLYGCLEGSDVLNDLLREHQREVENGR